ncbi:Hypothetical predicted protein [Olea europaea subsp. europaea]|uniref:Uncharacterized protein n=1 Tax=Olea europaea subsp. europaea TaxID=158383 RepID=A0A8S0TSA8_OLEEU|nr:Hypothetical predicted protein [Olea europaea subsp. europaea]
MVCKPCQGRRYTKAYFHAHEGSMGCGHMKIAPSPVHVKGASICRQHVVHIDAHRRHTRQHRVLAVAVTHAHFLAPSGTRCAGHVRDEDMFLDICRQFRGQGVQAMSGTLTHLGAFLGHGYVQDASWLRRGRMMIFRHMKAAWPCLGDILATEEKHPDFQEFLGIFGQFQGTVCRPFSGHFLAIAGTQPRPCPGLVLATSGRKQIFRHTEATWCADQVRDEGSFAGILGSFLDTVYMPSLGRGRDGCILIFRHFKSISGSGVHAMSGIQADFLAHEGSMVLGHVRDVGAFPSISGLLLGDGVQATSGKRPG